MINTVVRLCEPGRFCYKHKELNLGCDNLIARPVFLSVCKADVRYYKGERSAEVLHRKLPMALIHECCAAVVFDPLGKMSVGTAVVPVPLSPLEADGVTGANYLEAGGFCSSNCDGFMRSYISLPRERFVPCAPGLSPQSAAFTELASVAVHAVERFLRFSHERRETIGVWGDGSLGFLTALTLRERLPECRLLVFGASQKKLSLFTFADKAYLAPSAPRQARIDHAFECVGGAASQRAIAQIISLIKPEGTLSLLGVSEEAVPIPTRLILEKGLRLFGSSRSTAEDFKRVMRLAQSADYTGHLERLIGGVYPARSLGDISAAFEADISRHNGKTVIGWNL